MLIRPAGVTARFIYDIAAAAHHFLTPASRRLVYRLPKPALRKPDVEVNHARAIITLLPSAATTLDAGLRSSVPGV
uniref:Oxidoreductase n=1 Tax=Steinernema glaseri TaxID=37863 RepID=A0A1I7YFS1_9BILA